MSLRNTYFKVVKGDEKKKRNNVSSLVKIAKTAIEYVAVKKANANCLGLMYEPKRPEKIVHK